MARWYLPATPHLDLGRPPALTTVVDGPESGPVPLGTARGYLRVADGEPDARLELICPNSSARAPGHPLESMVVSFVPCAPKPSPHEDLLGDDGKSE